MHLSSNTGGSPLLYSIQPRSDYLLPPYLKEGLSQTFVTSLISYFSSQETKVSMELKVKKGTQGSARKDEKETQELMAAREIGERGVSLGRMLKLVKSAALLEDHQGILENQAYEANQEKRERLAYL